MAQARWQSSSSPTILPVITVVDDASSDGDWSALGGDEGKRGLRESFTVLSRPKILAVSRSNRLSGSYDSLNSASRGSGLEIPALADFASRHKSLAVPYSMLRPGERNPHFFGREDALQRIDSILLPRRELGPLETQQLPRTYTICGLGGVGKTELAREYAFSRQNNFDAVFWVEAEQMTQLADGFAAIASQLGYSDSSDKDRVVSRNLTLEWLGSPTIRPKLKEFTAVDNDEEQNKEASWLLVFNNADDYSLLQTFWPVSHRGSILITSRDPMARQGGSGVDLEPFKSEDAAKLLLRLLQVPDSQETCAASLALSTRLGGLPLAMTQIAALIQRLDMTLGEFLDYFDRQTNIGKVAQMKPTVLQDHYKHSLYTVWALDRLSPQALAALQVLSFLSPDSITESLLSPPLPTNPSRDFPESSDDYIMARLDLTKSSLVKRNKADSCLTIHRLVQDVVQAQMAGDRTVETMEFTARLILGAWPSGFLRFDHDTKSWNLSEQLIPHILRLQGFYKKHNGNLASEQVKKSLARLLLFAGW